MSYLSRPYIVALSTQFFTVLVFYHFLFDELLYSPTDSFCLGVGFIGWVVFFIDDVRFGVRASSLSLSSSPLTVLMFNFGLFCPIMIIIIFLPIDQE